MKILRILFYAVLLVLGSAVASIADTDSLFNGHDTEQPIEIVADNFTIDQDAKIATFEGRVEATQGNLIFTTETLRVFYETKKGKDEPSIVRLDAAGRFRMESPSEVAEGDWAIYDIKSKTITIAGNVTLRREQSVISGDRLEIDLGTGLSKFNGAPFDAETMQIGRVRGRFSLPDETK